MLVLNVERLHGYVRKAENIMFWFVLIKQLRLIKISQINQLRHERFRFLINYYLFLLANSS